MNKKYKIIVLIGIIAILPVIYYLSSLLLIIYGRIDFERWKIDKNGAMGYRLTIADRIIAQHVLIGLSKKEVIEKLGDDGPTQYFKDYNLVYRIGNERGFLGIDSEWLVMKIINEKVNSVDILKD